MLLDVLARIHCFVGRLEDVGLARVELALHAFDDPVPDGGGHCAFERINEQALSIAE